MTHSLVRHCARGHGTGSRAHRKTNFEEFFFREVLQCLDMCLAFPVILSNPGSPLNQETLLFRAMVDLMLQLHVHVALTRSLLVACCLAEFCICATFKF